MPAGREGPREGLGPGVADAVAREVEDSEVGVGGEGLGEGDGPGVLDLVAAEVELRDALMALVRAWTLSSRAWHRWKAISLRPKSSGKILAWSAAQRTSHTSVWRRRAGLARPLLPYRRP